MTFTPITRQRRINRRKKMKEKRKEELRKQNYLLSIATHKPLKHGKRDKYAAPNHRRFSQ